jgi:hypothetical protein
MAKEQVARRKDETNVSVINQQLQRYLTTDTLTSIRSEPQFFDPIAFLSQFQDYLNNNCQSALSVCSRAAAECSCPSLQQCLCDSDQTRNVVRCQLEAHSNCRYSLEIALDPKDDPLAPEFFGSPLDKFRLFQLIDNGSGSGIGSRSASVSGGEPRSGNKGGRENEIEKRSGSASKSESESGSTSGSDRVPNATSGNQKQESRKDVDKALENKARSEPKCVKGSRIATRIEEPVEIPLLDIHSTRGWHWNLSKKTKQKRNKKQSSGQTQGSGQISASGIETGHKQERKDDRDADDDDDDALCCFGTVKILFGGQKVAFQLLDVPTLTDNACTCSFDYMLFTRC